MAEANAKRKLVRFLPSEKLIVRDGQPVR